MSQESPVSLVELSFFAHATEDQSKVMRAAQKLIPKTCLDNVSFRRDNLRGHYGNQIIRFSSRVHDKETAKLIVEKIASELRSKDKEYLLSQIANHTDDKGNLYLRLDKQSAYLGEIKVGCSDPIRVRIKLRLFPKSLNNMVRVCRSLDLIPS